MMPSPPCAPPPPRRRPVSARPASQRPKSCWVGDDRDEKQVRSAIEVRMKRRCGGLGTLVPKCEFGQVDDPFCGESVQSPRVGMTAESPQNHFGTLQIQVLSAALVADIAVRAEVVAERRNLRPHRGPLRSFGYQFGFVHECNPFAEVYCQTRSDVCTVSRTAVIQACEDCLPVWRETFSFDVSWPSADTPPPLAFAVIHRGEHRDEALADGELAFFLAAAAGPDDWREWEVPLFSRVENNRPRHVGEGGVLRVRTKWNFLMDELRKGDGHAVDAEEFVERQNGNAHTNVRQACCTNATGGSRGLGGIHRRSLQRFGRVHELWVLATRGQRRCSSSFATRGLDRPAFLVALRLAAPALPPHEADELWEAAATSAIGAGGQRAIGYAAFRHVLEQIDEGPTAAELCWSPSAAAAAAADAKAALKCKPVWKPVMDRERFFESRAFLER
eukprot:TRINITY_DN74050_c0_g1_i1.p1 TRINITY_DN74050_c0_g1~~TRINITY_DN74050_c0_g1_i1.p1  ORF type:complete len:446 (-),score=66.50 TRINITY_DN74050_c0_g1_i1:58-1395(-)